ncbi:78-dihydro-8-oxoguanine triphosphatase [Holotrichia oblita]|uniref:78-dihydro-8-oxoguanine triphosphatase n=1 Tax=Holotrichia oblita TaxID=644536 RepID=A0ACB9SPM7_HOLOL|nr:78-dihydro-8-oxoguanine triphosphatase [Holotrichia oblita]
MSTEQETNNNNNNTNKTVKFTLIFIKNSEKILLGLKKRGFGAGKWNGFGGKVEKNESILDGAIRELKEESNLTVTRSDMKYLGYVRYDLTESLQTDIVYVFIATKFSGNLAETEEMSPKWFKIDEIPYDKMWVDSKDWLPIVLRNRGLLAKYVLSGERDIQKKSVEDIDVPELV